MMKRIFFSTALIAFASACSTSQGRFTLATINSKAPIEDRVKPVGTQALVSGQSCSNWALFIPVSSFAKIGEAYDDALTQAPGAEALQDAVVESYVPVFSFLYNRVCYRVKGRPVAFK